MKCVLLDACRDRSPPSQHERMRLERGETKTDLTRGSETNLVP